MKKLDIKITSNFECSLCKAPVWKTNTGYEKTCEHTDTAITANMSAITYGISKVQ